MEIAINKDIKIHGNTAVALGNFDGIHIGHQVLIETVVKKSKVNGLIPSVFTFNNHTSKFLKENSVGRLLSKNRKIAILEDLDIELLYMVDFNEEIRHLSPEDFVRKILVDRLNTRLVVVGFNFRFGYKGIGDTNALVELGKQFGFDVIVIEQVIISDEVVSSSLIRQLITNGNIKKANKMLGREFIIEGKVIQGKSIGKTLGFPTANLELRCNYITPKFGVYKTYTYYMGKKYSSITNVGYNPTFGDNHITIETHILNFNGDLYNKDIKVEFEMFIREEMKFNSKEDLILQINKDISSTYDV